MSMIDKLTEDIKRKDKEIKELKERITLLEEEFNLIYRIGEMVGACLEFERVCTVVLQESMKEVHGDSGLFIMKDEGGLKVVASVGFGEDKILQYQKEIDKSLIKECISNNKEKISSEVCNYPEAKILNIKNILVVPADLCVLAVGRQQKKFAQKDLQIIKILAKYSLSMIKNAQFYLQMQELFFDTILALSLAIDTRDPYTAGHSKKVKEIALKIGEQLDLSEKDKRILQLASLLHDIGKLTIPEQILTKPDKLTDEEYEIVKKHPEAGVKIISNISMLKEIIEGVAQHQERYDGGGYPKGLKGKDISLFGRILAVADAYDAMTSERAYRRALTKEEALKELKRCSGTQFDPEIVEAFLSSKFF